MTQAARGDFTNRDLYGDDLLAELRGGHWGLPNKTLLALVVGGLRVRMMRSIVTTISVVLAIAFLCYIGLSTLVEYNMVVSLQAMEEQAILEAEEIETAAATLQDRDPFEGVGLERQREIALAWDMEQVDEQIKALNELTDPLLKAESNARQAADSLIAIEGKAEVDPLELEEAKARSERLREQFEELQAEKQQLSQQVALADWLEGKGEADDDMAEQLRTTLEQRADELLATAQTPARFSEAELDRFELLLSLLETEAGGESSALATMRQALAQEHRKRAAMDLKRMLLRANVNEEATLAGNPLDTWLIIMALLTCTVGIANAMLMSVTERFREIGTMKCLGAQDSLVVKLFLLESAFQGVVGAAIGLGVGLLVSFAAAIAQYGGFGITNFPGVGMLKVIGWSILAGMLLSVVGAVYPALVAARMAPVDALRVEE